MWREIINRIGIELLDLLQDKLRIFTFPKTRLRYNYRKKLKNIVESASSLFDYASDRTCSLLNLIRIVKCGFPSNTPLSMKFEMAEEKANILREWYRFYKDRIEICYLSKIGKLFDEYGQILLRVQGIFEELTRDLREDSIIQKLKRETYGYPMAKKIFQTTSDEFSKLTEEASQKLKEIKNWTNIFSLPEL